MSKLTSLIRRAPKRFSAAILMVAAAIIIPAAAFAWGPTRPTYTIANPADHITFNSITNNPNIGDERNFVGIREAGSANVWHDDMTVQKNKEYIVRMYVHNNAADNLNLVAENVTAEFYLPVTTGKSIQVNGFLRASNATPAEVYDHATFKASENFNLDYIEGSLKYENNVFGTPGVSLPETIFTTTGAKLGYDKLDGKIPGCFKYAGYVSFKVKPQFAPETPNFEVKKDVRKAGTKDFVESVASKPGDKLNYRITYKNTGNTQSNAVILKDKLPAGVNFVPGTVYILNAANPNGAYVQDGDKLFSTGINIGNYTPGSNALIAFDAIVNENVNLPICGTNTLRNVASAQPQGQNPKEDTADTTLTKECEPGKISVCELSTKKIIMIDENQFDSSKHTEDFSKCDSTTTKITVCELATNKIISIEKSQFDAKKHSEDLTKCELPQTGPTENIVALVGLSALIASIAYYVASRRALNQ
jgi:uncharacterized repeat protein (TIGR01451 family)